MAKIQIDVPPGYEVLVVKKPDAKKKVTAEWIEEQRATYPGIDLDAEFKKMQEWISRNAGRQLTRKFFENWLRNIDPAFYGDKRKADILREVDVIKGRGWQDSMGWHYSEKDAARIKELRTEYSKL